MPGGSAKSLAARLSTFVNVSDKVSVTAASFKEDEERINCGQLQKEDGRRGARLWGQESRM